MNKYRKKPVVIEAFQMTEARRWDNQEWPDWLHRAWNKEHNEVGALLPETFLQPKDASVPSSFLAIHTLEGTHRVSWGDWIIQGVKGEIYPCKPDIFAITYDKEA